MALRCRGEDRDSIPFSRLSGPLQTSKRKRGRIYFLIINPSPFYAFFLYDHWSHSLSTGSKRSKIRYYVSSCHFIHCKSSQERPAMRNQLKHSRLRFGFLLGVISMGLTACASDENRVSPTKEVTQPPIDDSETSSVRVTTSWIRHSLSQTDCLKHARAALTKARYFVDAGERSVFGLREGMTISIRCDYEGVAFFAVAYRHRPSTQMQDRILNDITRLF